MMRDMWPNFFIVGAAKAGTTSLYEYLDDIPNVFMSTIKEPHFFAPNVKAHLLSKIVRDPEEYLNLFRGAEHATAIGEASPSYLWDKDSPRRIHNIIPNAKIIAILRDPITRAFSHYLMNLRTGLENRSFYDALNHDYNRTDKGWGISHLYVEIGLYADRVKEFIDTFGRERVKILIFEEFVADPFATVSNVMQFLEVDGEIPINVNTKYNSGSASRPRWTILNKLEKSILTSCINNITLSKFLDRIPIGLRHALREKVFQKQIEKPILSQDAKSFLNKIYSDDTEKLKSIINHTLPWSIE
jgi:hypothetical protein